MSTPEPLVVGESVTCGVHDADAFVYRMDEFIGSSELDPNHRVAATVGQVLFMVDICVPRALFYFMFRYRCPAVFKMPGDVSMSTVSFNCSLVHAPVYNGDLLLTETRVVHIGSSSAGLHTVVRRQSFDAPDPVTVSEHYTTMVTVDALNPVMVRKGCLPAVRLTRQKDVERHRFYGALKSQSAAIKQIYKAAAVAAPPLPPAGTPSTASPTATLDKAAESERTVAPLQWASVELEWNKTAATRRTPESTKVCTQRIFSSEFSNVNQAVFGGEILRMMELIATHCARVFCGNAHVETTAMLDMVFEQPILVTDTAFFSAVVTCVEASRLVVDVVAQRLSQDDCAAGVSTPTPRATATHASMVFSSCGASGDAAAIHTGLDLSRATPLELANYAVGARFLAFISGETKHTSDN